MHFNGAAVRQRLQVLGWQLSYGEAHEVHIYTGGRYCPCHSMKHWMGPKCDSNQ